MNKYIKFGLISATSAALVAFIASRKGGSKAYVRSVARKMGYTKFQKYPILMDTILKGESHTYNDYNYKISGGYGSFLYGKSKGGTITKKLTDLTIAEVMSLQNAGKLYAVGRYQIIPSTLKVAVGYIKANTNEKFDDDMQDKLGTSLIDYKRPYISQYLNGKVADTAQNLTKAVYQTAMEWSSVANPYTGVSVYSQDRASTSADSARTALKEQRKALGK